MAYPRYRPPDNPQERELAAYLGVISREQLTSPQTGARLSFQLCILRQRCEPTCYGVVMVVDGAVPRGLGKAGVQVANDSPAVDACLLEIFGVGRGHSR